MKPRCADLFCGAGGAAMGLHRAGFEVVGWDINPQPHYPFEFRLGDALEADLDGFDFVWASPPCQAYTRMNRGLLESQGRKKAHPDLVGIVRNKLTTWARRTENHYIIENVTGAPLMACVVLCGSQFGLDVQRHRLFESNVLLMGLDCKHWAWVKDKPSVHRLYGKSRIVGCYGNGRGKGDNVATWQKAMGIDWMTRKELSQAIPPAYSEFLGRQIMKILTATKAA